MAAALDLELTQRRRRDLRRLGSYFLGMVVTAPFIGLMLDAAWATRGVSYHSLWVLLTVVGIDAYALILLSAGVYLGWLALLWADVLKRKQAVLLALGTIIVLGALVISGRWTDVGRAVDNLPALLVGGLVGLVAGGGSRLIVDDGPHEFRRAALQLFWFVAVLVVGGLFERHLVYNSPIRRSGETIRAGPLDLQFVDPIWLPVDLVFGTLFLVLLYQFVQYEACRSIVVIGPPESGKTSFVVGLYDQARSESRNFDTFDVDEALADAHWRFQQEGFGGLEDRPDDVFTRHQFTYTSGGMFPQHVTVTAPDYTGRTPLNEVVDKYRRMNEARGPLSRFGIGRREPPSVGNRIESVRSAGATRLFAEYAIAADLLVIVVPARDFVPDDREVRDSDLPAYYDPDTTRDPGEYLPQLRDLSVERPEGTGALLVTTMADLYAGTYERKHTGAFVRNHYQHGPENAPSFREYVTRRQRLGRAAFRTLADDASESYTYPFYHEMRDDDEPRPVHLDGPSETFDTVGAKDILDRIRH